MSLRVKDPPFAVLSTPQGYEVTKGSARRVDVYKSCYARSWEGVIKELCDCGSRVVDVCSGAEERGECAMAQEFVSEEGTEIVYRIYCTRWRRGAQAVTSTPPNGHHGGVVRV